MSTTTKKKKAKQIESYYQTDNEWHNQHIVSLIAEIRQDNLFDELFTPLDLYNLGLDSFEKNYKAPLKVIELLDNEFKLRELNPEQSVFLLKKIKAFISKSEYDEEGIMDHEKDMFMEIFEADVKNKALIIEGKKPKPTNVNDMRIQLKSIMQSELDKLPEYLNELTPKERLNIIHKFMPFILPKTESIHFERKRGGF